MLDGFVRCTVGPTHRCAGLSPFVENLTGNQVIIGGIIMCFSGMSTTLV